MLSAKDLLASCAYVDQHPYLFSGSLRENLTLGAPLSDDEILAAAGLVDMGDFLIARGLDTSIADRGTNVSQGQRYRLALIRAILTRKTFLLLDEPFAGVDPIAVGEIQRIVRFLRDRQIGVLITDHNVRETLGICDHAYIISEGSVLAAGKPDEIIENDAVRRVYLGENFRM
jgi:lipopolysaccharide export system ATP-binding protein